MAKRKASRSRGKGRSAAARNIEVLDLNKVSQAQLPTLLQKLLCSKIKIVIRNAPFKPGYVRPAS